MNTPCILAVGKPTKGGYIWVRNDAGRMAHSHRTEWEKYHGPIPKGKCVMHECDNPPCRNIEHLKLGTQKQNMLDMIARGRNAYIGSKEFGELHPSSKLTNTDVVWIRYLRSLGMVHREIARIIGISRRNVATVCLGQTWKHILSSTVEV